MGGGHSKRNSLDAGSVLLLIVIPAYPALMALRPLSFAKDAELAGGAGGCAETQGPWFAAFR